MPTALMLVLVAVGSVLFHVLSPWWWTPITSNWRYIDDTITITFWITGGVFTAIVLFMAYCVFRFRHKPGTQAAYEPENKKLEIGSLLVSKIPGRGSLPSTPKECSTRSSLPNQWHWAGFVSLPLDSRVPRRSAVGLSSPSARLGISSHVTCRRSGCRTRPPV
jgi:cytochrome c oxidase subunit 2